MKKWKKILAVVGVILILAVFCLPMIFAFNKGGNAGGMFWGALGLAFVAPMLIYMFLMAYRIFGKKEEPEKHEIENVIFDIGNVLLKFGWEQYLQSYGFGKDKYEKIADATFRSKIWAERDRGLLSEEEYVQQCVNLAPEYEEDIREVMAHTEKCIQPFEYSETWVRYLKSQGYGLYILSNYGNYMLEKNRSLMSFLKYMDGVIFSCEVKQIKPEREIYETLLKRYNLDPSKSVFLDDALENCKSAEKAGIHAIQFKNFKQAAAELEKLGVK